MTCRIQVVCAQLFSVKLNICQMNTENTKVVCGNRTQDKTSTHACIFIWERFRIGKNIELAFCKNYRRKPDSEHDMYSIEYCAILMTGLFFMLFLLLHFP